MANAYVNTCSAGGSSGTITLTPAATTSASCFLVAIYYTATGSVTISAPSMTNVSSWLSVGATSLNSIAYTANSVGVQIYYGFASGSPSGNITITYSGSINSIGAMCDQFTGI